MAFAKKNGSYLVLDLGSYSIKFLHGSFDGNSIKVNNAFVVKTPKDAYSDGKINDFESLVTTIKSALSKNKIKEKKCILTFNSKDMIQKELSVPELSYEDTVGLIRYEISQFLPIDVDEYDVTFKNKQKIEILKENLNEEITDNSENQNKEKELEIISYIVKKTLVEGLYELIISCGLSPVFLDLHSNALSKFLNHVTSSESKTDLVKILKNGAVAFVDLGYKNILIDICDAGRFTLSRIVDSSLNEQDILISEQFDMTIQEASEFREQKISENILDMYYIYEKTKDFVFEEAEITKEEIGIGEGILTDEEKRIFTLLNESMLIYEVMSNEISKVLDYFTNRMKNKKPDKILLHGFSSSNSSLIDFLNKFLEFKFETLDFEQITNIKFLKNVENKSAYINAMGALIRREED